MDKEVVFNESLEDFYAALESEKSDILDDWEVRFGEGFGERD